MCPGKGTMSAAGHGMCADDNAVISLKASSLMDHRKLKKKDEIITRAKFLNDSRQNWPIKANKKNEQVHETNGSSFFVVWLVRNIPHGQVLRCGTLVD